MPIPINIAHVDVYQCMRRQLVAATREGRNPTIINIHIVCMAWHGLTDLSFSQAEPTPIDLHEQKAKQNATRQPQPQPSEPGCLVNLVWTAESDDYCRC